MPDPAADAPEEHAALASTVEEIDAALLGGTRRYTARDLAARADISLDFVQTFWSTLGLPHPDPDDDYFSENDADAIGRAASLVRDHGLDLRTVLTVTRALGHTSDRLALWQVEALVEDMSSRYELDDTTARLLVLDRLADLAPVLEAQLVHSYRRQLAAIAGRYAAEFGDLGRPGDDEPGALPLARAVGFADMVSFTRRTAGLGSTDLSAFVQRFEAEARDVVTAAGGRVVKTIGDAVLFVADTPQTGALVALGLADALGRELDVSSAQAAGGLAEGARGVTPVRVGFVWGRVLSRFGDVFGPSVNLAARLTDIAEPSTVLVDQGTAAVLASDARFVCEEQPVRELQGLGTVTPVRLRATPG
ncbi:adenylate/guanylate cyclase domain-containing protein [Cellulomonas uda]|uniref:adenylate/guanylate cyclase domain-containing protein n=1 Tax=Cellulomonas uda TaxID=1714 RepID=UPI001FD28DA9|nr:adenylate/guanylate cyclase domain-containing protein [Cellulomonas uda]NII67334.1 adenylate cyclase [Cellulomonas uda]